MKDVAGLLQLVFTPDGKDTLYEQGVTLKKAKQWPTGTIIYTPKGGGDGKGAWIVCSKNLDNGEKNWRNANPNHLTSEMKAKALLIT